MTFVSCWGKTVASGYMHYLHFSALYHLFSGHSPCLPCRLLRRHVTEMKRQNSQGGIVEAKKNRTTRCFHLWPVSVYDCAVSQRQIWRRLIWGAVIVSVIVGSALLQLPSSSRSCLQMELSRYILMTCTLAKKENSSWAGGQIQGHSSRSIKVKKKIKK